MLTPYVFEFCVKEMKHIFSYSVKPATHFLAKRKPNKHVNALLSELFPHVSETTCTDSAFEDFIDVMWALGMSITKLDTIDLDASGNRLCRKPVKNEG